MSILTVACHEGYYSIAELLIKRSAKVNTQTSCGFLLSRACVIDYKAIVLLFIQNGAEINYLIKVD